jgi:hypothetical protein
MSEAQMIENKRTRLQALINAFENQAATFLVHDILAEDVSISSLGDYDEFDHPDFDDDMTTPHHSPRAPDGSGMDAGNPEDIPILLPSSFGWKWCSSHNAKSLAIKESQLRHAQANDAIHQIRLALGFKSALFRTQVRPANTQQTKTRAWNAVHNVDSTLSEHARSYSMARDAYRKLRNKSTIKAELPPLSREDMHIATLVLGSEITGQRNMHRSWIWSFGKMTADDGTWMDDCELSLASMNVCVLTYQSVERVHWLRAKAQFERWLEEQDSIHNEAHWIPAFFTSKAETWRQLMAFASQGSLKGHTAYASYQMYAWEELSNSSKKALSPITDTSLKHYDFESLLLS